MKVRDSHRAALVVMAQELNERLTRVMRKLAKDRYFTQETRVIVAQARVVAEVLGAEYGDHIYTVIKQVGHDAATRGRDSLVHEIEAWGPEFTGSMRRLVRVHEASDALDPGLLDYYRVSRETYGMEAIDKMHRILALANLSGETVAQTTDKLSQVMALPAWRADRIVRTEQAFALSRRRLLDLRALGEDHLWRKQLIATFDDRTADDSKFVHGQVRRLDEPFIDNKGRHYQYPPNRPNDREVMVFIPVVGARPAPEPDPEEGALEGEDEVFHAQTSEVADPAEPEPDADSELSSRTRPRKQRDKQRGESPRGEPPPRDEQRYRNVKYIFSYLEKAYGISKHTASDRLHTLKDNAGRKGADNVEFTLDGRVYTPENEYLGTLLED